MGARRFDQVRTFTLTVLAMAMVAAVVRDGGHRAFRCLAGGAGEAVGVG